LRGIGGSGSRAWLGTARGRWKTGGNDYSVELSSADVEKDCIADKKEEDDNQDYEEPASTIPLPLLHLFLHLFMVLVLVFMLVAFLDDHERIPRLRLRLRLGVLD
jgi:hypothetical protein